MAGDVTGDGANDLLLGAMDGTLTLLINDVLEDRGQHDHPTYHQAKLAQSKIVAVAVSGHRGVLGTRVELRDEDDNIVGLRRIGGNVGVGSRGPDTVNFVVREPQGIHTLTVRFADGWEQSWQLPMDEAEALTKIEALRD